MFRNIEMGAPCRSPRREQPEPSLLAARQSVCYIIFCKQEVCTYILFYMFYSLFHVF